MSPNAGVKLAETHFSIRSKGKGDQFLDFNIPNQSQRQLCLSSNLLVVSKNRQLGISTYINGYTVYHLYSLPEYQQTLWAMILVFSQVIILYYSKYTNRNTERKIYIIMCLWGSLLNTDACTENVCVTLDIISRFYQFILNI